MKSIIFSSRRQFRQCLVILDTLYISNVSSDLQSFSWLAGLLRLSSHAANLSSSAFEICSFHSLLTLWLMVSLFHVPSGYRRSLHDPFLIYSLFCGQQPVQLISAFKYSHMLQYILGILLTWRCPLQCGRNVVYKMSDGVRAKRKLPSAFILVSHLYRISSFYIAPFGTYERVAPLLYTFISGYFMIRSVIYYIYL